jgi:hypothetical protein
MDPSRGKWAPVPLVVMMPGTEPGITTRRGWPAPLSPGWAAASRQGPIASKNLE